jgi:hypothetical protein
VGLTDEERARLREQAEISIWYACRAPFTMKSQALATVSRFGVDAGLGRIHDLTVTTVLLRAGLQLNVDQQLLGKLFG